MTKLELWADGHSVRRADGTTYAVADTPEIAKQIAALPELLEACEIALSFMGNHWPKSEPTAMLRAAIAKCEGGAP